MDTKFILIGLTLSAVLFIAFRCYVYFVEKDMRKLERRNEKLERDNRILSAAWLEDEETLRIMAEIATASEKETTNDYGVMQTTPIKKNKESDKGYFEEF